MDTQVGEYVISEDKSKVQLQVVIDYLAQSYWANKRSPDIIRKSIENSDCYGVYLDGKQIAFARIVTDGATVFYLCDVFVLPEYQGHGIGKKLMEAIVSSEKYEWMLGLLGTRDAHGLYEQYGFERDENRFMKRVPQARSHYDKEADS